MKKLLIRLKNVIRKNFLILGITFVLISFLSFFFTEYLNVFSSLFFGASYYLGVFFISNYIFVKISEKSFLGELFRQKKHFIKFILVCFLGALIFSSIVSVLGGLWYFPYWSTRHYFVIGYLLGGWPFYLTVLISANQALKLWFDKIFKGKQVVTKYYKGEGFLYFICFIIGIFSLIAILYELYLERNAFSNFFYNITTEKIAYLSWEFWLFGFFGLFFILEYILYLRRKASFMKNLLHGYFSPILALIFASLIMALTNEIQNFGVYLWRYANYPLENITIFDIPIFIILTWPLHIIGIVELWNALSPKEITVLAEGDKIV
jgi:hypothetical protein